jgi:hypothetical protein
MPYAGLALVALIVGSSGMGPSRSAGMAPASQSSEQAGPVPSPAVSPSPSRTPGSELPTSEPPAMDITTAIGSRDRWVPYLSVNYHFKIKYPADWKASEDQIQGWTVISGWDDSNISITWRSIPAGTTLGDITDEVWKAMHDNGFTVIGSAAGTIVGLPARILTVDGTNSLRHARHGIVGIVVTPTGRYRVELWSRPGSEARVVELYGALVATFETA